MDTTGTTSQPERRRSLQDAIRKVKGGTTRDIQRIGADHIQSVSMKAGLSSPTVQQPVRHHLPPALMTFPHFRDELGDALAGLDTAEEVLAADPSDAGARDGLSAKVAALSSSLSAAVERRCSEKDIVPRCFEVIDIGRSKFEPVYNSTFDAISSSEEAGAAECSDAVRRLIDAAQGRRPTQKSDDVVQLYAAAASIREQVRGIMKAVAGETGAELAEIPEKARRRHGLKQIVRIVEKCALRPDEPGKADRVCDIVRDMFSVSSMEQMAKVADALLSCSEIAIVRVKDRNAEPSAGGWRDIMINFVLVGDENAHVCEVQLVHKKMLLQRKEMDGHLYYGRVRIATEVLEKLRFLGSSERLTRVKELHAAGTTTAAALKHIGVPLADLLHGGFPANELRAAGYPQAEILAVLSPAERLRAAQACDELVSNAAQPSEAETLAGYLNHALLHDEAVAALLRAEGAVAKLMSLAADAAVPAEARVLVMDGVLYCSRQLTRAAFREAGALDKCLAILASTDAPQLVHAAARKMLGAAADRADVVRREDAIAQLALQPGSDAAGAARTLASIAGRREALSGYTVFDGGYLLQILQTKPGALEALVTWLQAAPPEQAEHLAVVVAAIAPSGDDARLLNVGVIAALLSHLPAASSAEALALIAESPLGQERLWQANAIPKLLEVATGKDHSAAVHAARAIGSLAVHATGQDAMSKLVARAKESDAALELLGEAMQQDAAAALAAEAHGALELLRIAVGKQGVSATAALAAARMAANGTRAQVLALVGAGVVEAAAAVLRRANVSREDQSVAWRALDILIPAADEARERARKAGVVQLLSGAFERADAAALWALSVMGGVAGSDMDAVAIVEAGLAERVAVLIVVTEEDAAREVAHLAAAQLADLVQRQKGAMETETRNRVAVAALRSAITLRKAPPHIHFGHGNASGLLDALALSELGVSTTKQALNDVLEDPLARFNQANLLFKTGLLGSCFDSLGTDKDGAGKRLLHVLQEVNEPADQLALLSALRCLPGAAIPRPVEDGGVKIVQHLLKTSKVAVTTFAAAQLLIWATQPGVVADVLASGGITRLISVIKQNGEAADVGEAAKAVLALLQAAEAAGDVTKLASAVVNEGILAVLTSRLDHP